MKKILVSFIMLIAAITFAQKKELRTAKKQFDKQQFTEAQATLTANKALFEGAETKIQAPYYFLQAKLDLREEKFKEGLNNINKLRETGLLSEELKTFVIKYTTDVVNKAIEQTEAKDYKGAAGNLYLAYNVNPEANVDYLFFAASNSVNAKDTENALNYYLQLKELEYTGVTTKYYATLVSTGEEEELSENDFTFFKKSKDYDNFRTEDTESRLPEIVKNIALIYAQNGDNENAISAAQDARKENPDDIGLILTEANIYIQLEEFDKYKTLIKEALDYDPDNAVLYFNLGVVSKDLGEEDKAEEYYKKAIELDPTMESAYLNLVALILSNEKVIIDDMNSLGNSRADNVKYDKLKEQKDALYKQCVPILKKLIALDPKENQQAVKTLQNIYASLGDNDGFMEMKALIVEN